jgi:hypothetical protein
LREQALGRITVRIVATRAVHLALAYRVCVGLHRLRTLLLVAVEADFCLGRGCEDGVALDMHRVAICTGNGAVVMRAAVPRKTRVAKMALDAVRILVRDRGRGVRSECRDRWPFLPTPYATRVITAGAVAGFALQLSITEGGVRIIRDGMLRAKHCQDSLIVMTLETCVCAFLAVIRRLGLVICRLRRHGPGRGDGQKGHRQYRGSSNRHFGQHLHHSSLVELEIADTVHLADVGRGTLSMTQLASLGAGRHEIAVRIFRRVEVAAILHHVIRCQV